MEVFEVQLLGCGAALTAFNRLPSAQLLNIHEDLILIDCGEGTQFQLTKYNIRRSRINKIFISHLHGDHVFGLPGLITSYNLMNRTDDLTIFGPAGIEEMFRSILSFSAANLNYPLHFHEIRDFNGKVIYDNERLRVRSLPLDHKIPTSGFLFEEKHRKKKLDLDKINLQGIPVSQWKSIEDGEDITHNGQQFVNSELTFEDHAIRKYAYCSDTRYTEQILPYIQNVNVLYHETTYLEDLKSKAKDNGHSTAMEAALIASKAHAGALVTGHYSSRYELLDAFESECKSIFPNVIIGSEGLRIPIV